MRNLVATLCFAAGLILAGAAFAADTQPATKPTTTTSKPASPACCGDTCKKMGNCCKVDAVGKASCPMGGGCCNK